MSEFFGGFGLGGDLNLFSDLLSRFGIVLNRYDVCAFGDGTKEALGFALHCKTRINRLVLLSPMFCEDSKMRHFGVDNGDLRDFEADLLAIKNSGIKILVFLGGKDRAMDTSMEFFRDFGVVYLIKEARFCQGDDKDKK